MKDTLKTLIEIPTISTDLAANYQAIDYIDRFLRVRGMYIARHDFDGHPALVATTRDTRTPKIMLAGHIDVVPAPPAAFTMTQKDGRIYGRGAYDMKCAIAAYLQIIDDIKDSLDHYDLGIMITADEELGGEHGVKPLLELGYRPEACVLPDGGLEFKLEESAKGLIWYRLSATGTAAHGSRPWLGQSAIQKIMLALDAITKQLFSTQDPETSTLNIGTIQGGHAPNQVPAYCQADLDIRFTGATEEKVIKHTIEQICAEHDVAPQVTSHGIAVTVDLGNPYVVAWGKSFETITGQPLQTTRSLGGSDARWFAAKSIPTIVTYPKGEGLHGDNEWVDVQAFYQLKEIISNYIQTVAKTGQSAHATARTGTTVGPFAKTVDTSTIIR